MASRGIWRYMSVRTRRSLALTWTALFVFSLLLQYMSFATAAPVLAVHNEGVFELEGNATSSASLAGDDWDKIFNGTSGAATSVFQTGHREPALHAAARRTPWMSASGPGIARAARTRTTSSTPTPACTRTAATRSPSSGSTASPTTATRTSASGSSRTRSASTPTARSPGHTRTATSSSSASSTPAVTSPRSSSTSG